MGGESCQETAHSRIGRLQRSCVAGGVGSEGPSNVRFTVNAVAVVLQNSSSMEHFRAVRKHTSRVGAPPHAAAGCDTPPACAGGIFGDIVRTAHQDKSAEEKA